MSSKTETETVKLKLFIDKVQVEISKTAYTNLIKISELFVTFNNNLLFLINYADITLQNYTYIIEKAYSTVDEIKYLYVNYLMIYFKDVGLNENFANSIRTILRRFINTFEETLQDTSLDHNYKSLIPRKAPLNKLKCFNNEELYTLLKHSIYYMRVRNFQYAFGSFTNNNVNDSRYLKSIQTLFKDLDFWMFPEYKFSEENYSYLFNLNEKIELQYYSLNNIVDFSDVKKLYDEHIMFRVFCNYLKGSLKNMFDGNTLKFKNNYKTIDLPSLSVEAYNEYKNKMDSIEFILFYLKSTVENYLGCWRMSNNTKSNANLDYSNIILCKINCNGGKRNLCFDNIGDPLINTLCKKNNYYMCHNKYLTEHLIDTTNTDFYININSISVLKLMFIFINVKELFSESTRQTIVHSIASAAILDYNSRFKNSKDIIHDDYDSGNAKYESNKKNINNEDAILKQINKDGNIIDDDVELIGKEREGGEDEDKSLKYYIYYYLIKPIFFVVFTCIFILIPSYLYYYLCVRPTMGGRVIESGSNNHSGNSVGRNSTVTFRNLQANKSSNLKITEL